MQNLTKRNLYTKKKRLFGMGIAVMTSLDTKLIITCLFGGFSSTTLSDKVEQKINFITTKLMPTKFK